jgi:hypothetical protein
VYKSYSLARAYGKNRSESLRGLTSQDFMGNAIGDTGAAALAGSESLKGVRILL